MGQGQRPRPVSQGHLSRMQTLDPRDLQGTESRRRGDGTDVGLVSAVQDHLSNLERDDGISCHLEVRGTIARLEPPTERGVYYVVREALTNVRKHAGAVEVCVVIEFQDDSLKIEVADNGKGFEVSKKPEDLASAGKLGILGMYERTRLLGGTLEIKSELGKGTQVIIKVPS